MNRLSVTFFQRHNFFQFNINVQKAYSASRAAGSQPDRTAWVGIQNPAPNQAEYHIKGNGHMRVHMQGEKVSGQWQRQWENCEHTRKSRRDQRWQAREALPENLGPVPSCLKKSKREESSINRYHRGCRLRLMVKLQVKCFREIFKMKPVLCRISWI